MNRKALIVTIDEIIIPTAEDTIESLGHEFAHARSQAEARKLARENRFDYIVIDIAIPARKNGRSIEPVHGFHLLEEIRAMPHGSEIPVIICAGNTDCLDYVEAYQEKGATAFISKPFTCRLLAGKIRSALKRSPARSTITKPRRRTCFDGGELTIGKKQVTIAGCIVPVPPKVRRLLIELARRRPGGEAVALSGEELSQKLGLLRGQNAIAELVCGFRKRATEALADAGINCNTHDLIRSGGPGYRFNSWLTVQTDRGIRVTSLRDSNHDPVKNVNDPDRDPDAPVNDPDPGVDDPDQTSFDPDGDPDRPDFDPNDDPDPPEVDPDRDSVTDRQSRIINYLQRGESIRVGDLVMRLDCSHSTAKRELASLRKRGLIHFVGHPRTGHYRLSEQ